MTIHCQLSRAQNHGIPAQLLAEAAFFIALSAVFAIEYAINGACYFAAFRLLNFI